MITLNSPKHLELIYFFSLGSILSIMDWFQGSRSQYPLISIIIILCDSVWTERARWVVYNVKTVFQCFLFKLQISNIGIHGRRGQKMGFLWSLLLCSEKSCSFRAYVQFLLSCRLNQVSSTRNYGTCCKMPYPIRKTFTLSSSKQPCSCLECNRNMIISYVVPNQICSVLKLNGGNWIAKMELVNTVKFRVVCE